MAPYAMYIDGSLDEVREDNPNYNNRWSSEQKEHLSKIRKELGLSKGSKNISCRHDIKEKRRQHWLTNNPSKDKTWMVDRNSNKELLVEVHKISEYISIGYEKGRKKFKIL